MHLPADRDLDCAASHAFPTTFDGWQHQRMEELGQDPGAIGILADGSMHPLAPSKDQFMLRLGAPLPTLAERDDVHCRLGTGDQHQDQSCVLPYKRLMTNQSSGHDCNARLHLQIRSIGEQGLSDLQSVGLMR